MWTATIVLPEKFYLKNNLDRLFRFYSKSHPDKKERLIAHLFAGTETLEIDSSRSRQGYDSDAIFERQGDGAASGGGDNEWYSYAPELDKPQQRVTVVLKGGRRFAPKIVLDTWTDSIGPQEVRLRSYELAHIEPKGFYYTFEAKTSGNADWEGIMTLRLEEKVPLQTKQLHTVNDRVAYFSLGWMYAVTIDGGNTWSVWDAQTDIAENSCSNCYQIQNVQINADGTGIMDLNLSAQQDRSVRELRTKDYGKHWAMGQN